MKQAFRNIKLSAANKTLLDQINSIIEEYQAEGYVLTLRQLYYQLVSRNIIENRTNEYKKLSKILIEGRMAGIVDWEAIEDRVRVPWRPSCWSGPKEIMEAVADQYRKDRMEGQVVYLEVWVEKDALSGVLKRVTQEYGINILVNRGYSSASAMYDSYHRFRKAILNEQEVTVLYLGDFDPSGIDMIRDIEERSLEFLYNCKDLNRRANDWGEDPMFFQRNNFSIVPIALNRQQIAEYNPPPNVAKTTDSRYSNFASEHGSQSWEVDALRPEVLNSILQEAIESRIDLELLEQVKLEEEDDRKRLFDLIEHLP